MLKWWQKGGHISAESDCPNMELSELLAGDSDVDMMARLSSDTLTLFSDFVSQI